MAPKEVEVAATSAPDKEKKEKAGENLSFCFNTKTF